MRAKVWFTVIVAAVLFGVVGWTGYGQKTQQQRAPRWDYKVVYVPGVRSMSEQTLNELGAQGWELVTFQALNNEGGTIGAGNYFFKRARPSLP